MSSLIFNPQIYDRTTGRTFEPVHEINELTTEVERLEKEIAEKESSLEHLHASLSTTDPHQLLGNLTQSFHLKSIIQHLGIRLAETQNYRDLCRREMPLIQALRKIHEIKYEKNSEKKKKLAELQHELNIIGFGTRLSLNQENLDSQISEITEDLRQEQTQSLDLLQSATTNPTNLDLKYRLLELGADIFNNLKKLEILNNCNHLMNTEGLPIRFPRNLVLEKIKPSSLDRRIIEMKYHILPSLEKELASLELLQTNQVTLHKKEITNIKIRYALCDLEILERYNLKTKVFSHFNCEFQNLNLEQELIGEAIYTAIDEVKKLHTKIKKALSQ